MVAVADHHPVSILVEHISELVDIRGDLGLQRRRQHLPRTITD